MDSMPPMMPNARPRPEATAFPIKDLTAQQRSAFDEACQHLARIAESSMPETPSLNHTSAHNQVILIDGGRGAGKTSVLMTLLTELARPPFKREEPRLGKHRYVPLPILDLNPISDGISVLAHIAAHLWPASSRSARPPWHGEAGYAKLREAWRRFASQVHLAQSDGAARGNRDLETIAFEMERASSSWSTLSRGFYELLDGLVTVNGECEEGTPLFVLPVVSP